MIKTYPYEQLGLANFSWLNAKHHFSFSDYYNPDKMNFGTLRVINDDIIQAGGGFDMHPHKNMEIITYVRSGAITHRDNQGNEGRTEAGDVQVMSAGSGIFHSEYNLESETTSLYQIWIEPNHVGLTPQWKAHSFPKKPVTDALPLLVSGSNDAPLSIHQDARIYGGKLKAGTEIIHPIVHQAYILIAEGELTIDGQPLKKGDGAEVRALQSITIHATSDAEILVIDVPEK